MQWNRVPYKLQKEVGEFKEWSLQELLQRLMRAESRVEERECRSNPSLQKKRWSAESKRKDSKNKQTNTVRIGNHDKTAVTKAGAELKLKKVKCFGCHQKGHVLSDCPEKKAK